jgi:hypothetical protein
METWLVSIKMALDKKAQKTNVSLNTENLMKIFSMGADLTRPFEYLLATGNLRSKTGEIKYNRPHFYFQIICMIQIYMLLREVWGFFLLLF